MEQLRLLAAPAEVPGCPASQIPLMMLKTVLEGSPGVTHLIPPGLRTEPCRVRRGRWHSRGVTAWPHRCSPHGGGERDTQGWGHPAAQLCSCLLSSGAGQDTRGALPLWGLLNPEKVPAPGEFSVHSRGIPVPPGGNLHPKRVSCSHRGIPAPPQSLLSSGGDSCPPMMFLPSRRVPLGRFLSLPRVF